MIRFVRQVLTIPIVVHQHWVRVEDVVREKGTVVREEVKVKVGAVQASATTSPTTVVAVSAKHVSGSMRMVTVIVRVRMQQ